MHRNFLRAVIFDLGGTLMYERASWHDITAQGDEALTKYLIAQGMELNLSTFPVEFRRRLGEYFSQREHRRMLKICKNIQPGCSKPHQHYRALHFQRPAFCTETILRR